jgi:hypothetical protein
MKTNVHLSYLAEFFIEWERFQTNVVKEIKTHILCSVIFFVENRAVYEIMWKNIIEPSRPQMTIWHAGLVRLQTHTLTTCNIHCFSTATVVVRKRLSACLFSLIWLCCLCSVSYIICWYVRFVLVLYGRVFTICHFANHKQIQWKQYYGGGNGLKVGNFSMQKEGHVRNSLQN